MKSNYKALSELIEKVDERNADGAITELIGVSIDKCFIKSVANTNGTDLLWCTSRDSNPGPTD